MANAALTLAAGAGHTASVSRLTVAAATELSDGSPDGIPLIAAPAGAMKRMRAEIDSFQPIAALERDESVFSYV